ncbi:MAG TPA: class I SAM-dependent methyltransferase [Ktedonobacterales bacterium]|nr:class I SAM-dependent methyltransferase [Ktedonobacterales bacterium]
MSDSTDTSATEMRWSEEDSSHFLDFDDVVVPRRAEQIATLCRLIPAQPEEPFTAVELAAGGGSLARAVLDAFPRCHYIALDGSATMRERLRTVLAPYGDRVEVGAFTIEAEDWRHTLPRPLRCVLSSLCIHHLTGDGKRALYADLAVRLEPGGALLIGDLVAPTTEHARLLFAEQWDAATREQSLAFRGALDAYQRFRETDWNHFAQTEPDPMDMPSPLFDQLVWLRDAGFTFADCFWMYAGHAIYGGYR